MQNLISHAAIEAELARYPVVTFDVFDTLLVRKPSIEPGDIFYWLALEKGLGPAKAEMFRSARTRSEALQRELKQLDEGHAEVHLDDIYAGMGARCCGITAFDELSFEGRFLERRAWMWPIYQMARRMKKRVFAISDIYLDAATVRDLLAVHGIEVDDVLASADHRGGKYDKTLYRQFLKVHGLHSSDVIHIGDNRHSDYQMAVAVGMRALHIPRAVDQLFVNGGINLHAIREVHRSEGYFARMLLASLSRRLDASGFGSVAQQFGSMYAAPLVFLFARWIEMRARERGLDKVLLMTRDGHTLRAAMEKACPRMKTELFFCSRRSLMLPAAHLDETLWPAFFKTAGGSSIAEVVTGLFLDAEVQIVAAAARLGFDPQKARFDELPRAIQQRFLDESRHLADAQIRREYGETRDYLRSLGVADRCVAVVDVGWSLSSHKAIEKLCGAKVNGLYLGTSQNAVVHEGIESFLFHQEDDAQWSHVFHRGVELLEMPFMSCERQVVSIRDGEFVYRTSSLAEVERQLVASEIRAEVLAFAGEAAQLGWADKDILTARPMLRGLFTSLVNSPILSEHLRLGLVPHDRSISDAGYSTVADYWRAGMQPPQQGDDTTAPGRLLAAFARSRREHGLRFALGKSWRFIRSRIRRR